MFLMKSTNKNSKKKCFNENLSRSSIVKQSSQNLEKIFGMNA